MRDLWLCTTMMAKTLCIVITPRFFCCPPVHNRRCFLPLMRTFHPPPFYLQWIMYSGAINLKWLVFSILWNIIVSYYICYNHPMSGKSAMLFPRFICYYICYSHWMVGNQIVLWLQQCEGHIYHHQHLVLLCYHYTLSTRKFLPKLFHLFLLSCWLGGIQHGWLLLPHFKCDLGHRPVPLWQE
jgi:hypothetical protein